MELLTIILKTVQILSVLILTVIVLTIIAIKIKAKSKVWDLSTNLDGNVMNQVSKNNNEISFLKDNTRLISKKFHAEQSQYLGSNKVFSVYNPKNNPHFYTHNKLNWYKNFD